MQFFFYVFLSCLRHTLQNVDMYAILWALNQNNTGVDLNIVILFGKYIVFALFYIFILNLLVFKTNLIFKLFHGNSLRFHPAIISISIKLKRFTGLFWLLFFTISVYFFVAGFINFVNKTDIFNFIEKKYFAEYPKYDFIKDNYEVPPVEEIVFNKKSNLIIILSESLEETFFDKSVKKHIEHKIPLEKSQSVNNFKSYTNLNFTIAALTGWHFGLPLNFPKDPNYFRVKGHFLTKAQSIFDVLNAKGYSQHLILGSDKEFSGKDVLFESHGNFKIKDKKFFEENAFDLDLYKGSGWGYSDRFILEYGFKEYKKLKENNQPFVLFIEMVDGHFPDGWCPPDMIKYNDLRDVFSYVDYELSKFVKKFQNENDEDTVLFVLGDHFFMGNPDFIKDAKERNIFNAIYNVKKSIPKEKRIQEISALDIAPTLLEAAGAELDDGKFGLGVSLFSKEESLVNKLGRDKFDQYMTERSRFYESLL